MDLLLCGLLVHFTKNGKNTIYFSKFGFSDKRINDEQIDD